MTRTGIWMAGLTVSAFSVTGCSGAGGEEAYGIANRCVASAEEMIERIDGPDAAPGMESRRAHFEDVAATFRQRQSDAADGLGKSSADIEADRSNYRALLDDPAGYSTETLAQDIAGECSE